MKKKEKKVFSLRYFVYESSLGGYALIEIIFKYLKC